MPMKGKNKGIISKISIAGFPAQQTQPDNLLDTNTLASTEKPPISTLFVLVVLAMYMNRQHNITTSSLGVASPHPTTNLTNG